MNCNFEKPDGFREVSQKEFYAYMISDVIPHPEKTHSSWETRRRETVGYSTPGYMCQGRKAYYLKDV